MTRQSKSKKAMKSNLVDPTAATWCSLTHMQVFQKQEYCYRVGDM